MNRQSLLSFYLFLGAMIVLPACAAMPVQRKPAGSAVSGGGNGQTAEFYRMARLFHFAAVKSKLELGLENRIPSAELNLVMLKISVEATSEPLLLDGVSVEAINYPPLTKVRFNSNAWRAKLKIDKYRLVVHEILGLLNYPDQGYVNSDKIASRSRLILSSVGVEFDGPGANDDILYTSEAGDPVVCRVSRDGFSGNQLVEFLLQPGGGVAAEKARVDADHWIDFVVNYDNPQQVHLRLAKNTNPVGGGQGEAIVDTTIDYFGKFRRMETWAGPYLVYCHLSSER